MGRQIIELTGEKIGSWTVIGEAGRQNGGVLWECQCSCGNVEELRSIELTSKRRLKCLNCSKLARMLPKGENGFNHLFDSYKQSSFRRKHKWELTREEFKDLTSSNCYYCAREPEQIITGRGRTKVAKDHGTYVYNGIDRIDSTVGYISSNVRSCCKWCNQAKNTMSELDFFKLIQTVYNTHFKK